MPERRGSRFAAEVLFLVALAVALTLAHLEAVEIAGAMLLGWLVVAAIEWVAWRSEPHYGSGLPPRYHVPLVQLPPPKPLEQVEQGYPEASRDDAPTWIASAALRAEVLGTWPVAAPAPPADDADEEEEPEPVFVPEQEASDPWIAIGLPPTVSDDAAEAEPDQPEPMVLTEREAGAVDHASWYTLDPLGDPVPKRRFRRGGASTAERGIRVPSRPVRRPLPSSIVVSG
jgi:hypothetical protein